MATRRPGRLRRGWRALRHSLRLRLVALFLLLALAMSAIFVVGMQKAMSVGWRDALRPLVADYVDRLVAEIGSPPSVERAQSIVQRLPVSVSISGPQVNWRSQPEPATGWRERHRPWREGQDDHEPGLLRRTTADGHQIALGLALSGWRDHPQRIGGITLAVLLALTLLAWFYVHRQLRPLRDIGAGARRFGAGDFGQPIPVRRHDELGDLAEGVNAMAHDIHQMLEARRALLLAISHELRSPLTRARLNVELLPEAAEVTGLRDALLRDLAEMRDLVADLLESERLAAPHAALQREPTDLGALAREIVAGLPRTAGQLALRLHIADDLPRLSVDRSRMRLLLRNLLGNALRHSVGASMPVELWLQPGEAGATDGEGAQGAIVLRVRDHGPGVDDATLPQLAQPFYRPDAARDRYTGGVGLGLYLCRLVAQAHGAGWAVRNARPGLDVRVTLPASLAEGP